jgi:hypothetical protein
MEYYFSQDFDALICNLFDKGLDVDDIMERLDLPDDERELVQNVVLDWVLSHDDRDNGNEPGDFGHSDIEELGY